VSLQIAVQGVGFGPLAMAAQGFLGGTPTPVPAPIDYLTPPYLGRPNVYARFGFPREDEDRRTIEPPKRTDPPKRKRRDTTIVELRRPKPSKLLLRLLEQAPSPPPTDRPITVPVLPEVAEPTVDARALRENLQDELDIAADEAAIALALWAEMQAWAHEAALTIDLMQELARAQRWAAERIRRRRRNAAAMAAALMLLRE